MKFTQRILLALLAALMLAALLSVPGFAAGSAEARIAGVDYATLAEAIADAEDGDTIELLQDITLSSNLTISKKLTITTQAPHSIDRDPALSGILFTVGLTSINRGDLTLSGPLTVNGSYGSSLFSVVFGSLTMEDGVLIQDNTAAGSIGGAIRLLDSSASFTMNGGRITNCSAGYYQGGAICVSGGTVNLNGGQIDHCYAQTGGAVYASGAVTINLRGCVITQNCAYKTWTDTVVSGMGDGSAIFLKCYNPVGTVYKMPTLNMYSGEITGNVGMTSAVYIYENPMDKLPYVNIYGGTIQGNKAGDGTRFDPTVTKGTGLYAPASGRVTIGGDAQILDEIYVNLPRSTTVQTFNLCEDFTGTLTLAKNALYTTGSVIAKSVNRSLVSCAATEAVAGRVRLVDITSKGVVRENTEFSLVPSANSYILGAHREIPESCTVTLMADETGDAVYQQFTVPYGGTLGSQLPAPKREGYRFLGWFDGSEQVLANTPITRDMTLTARWEKIIVYYTVTFRYANGVTADTTVTVEENTTLGSRMPTPTRDGYTFLGWFEGSAQVKADTPITEDLLLTAQWEKDIVYHTVTFCYADGETEDTVLTVADGEALGDRMPQPERHGYEFWGWFSGRTQISETTPITKDMTLTAKWEKVTLYVTVTFQYGDGSTEDTTVTLEEGTILGTRLPEPTREGFVFAGWFDGETRILADTPIWEDVTLTARWEEEIVYHTVTFCYADGVTEDTVLTVAGGEALGDRMPEPERAGYEFWGWFSGRQQFSPAIPITEDVTLTAKWEAKTFRITLDGEQTLTVTYGQSIGALPILEREGWFFQGWFDAEDNAYTADTIYLVDGDLELTSRWVLHIQLKKQPDGSIAYLVDGVKDTTYYGFVDYAGGKFLVANGSVVSTKSGLAQDPNNRSDWYYLAAGQAQIQYTGLAQYDGEWFYVENGKLDTTLSTVVEYNGGLFLVARGRLLRDKNGLGQDPVTHIWYYFSHGQVQTQFTGLAQYDGKWFYVQQGVFDRTFAGEIEYKGRWYLIKNGTMVQEIK